MTERSRLFRRRVLSFSFLGGEGGTTSCCGGGGGRSVRKSPRGTWETRGGGAYQGALLLHTANSILGSVCQYFFSRRERGTVPHAWLWASRKLTCPPPLTLGGGGKEQPRSLWGVTVPLRSHLIPIRLLGKAQDWNRGALSSESSPEGLPLLSQLSAIERL